MSENDREAGFAIFPNPGINPCPTSEADQGETEVETETPHPSISTLHKQWVKLENEHHELAMAIGRAGGADLTAMRERQAGLLSKIDAVVEAIRHAPGTTVEDFIALLDVALERELGLACDIAF